METIEESIVETPVEEKPKKKAASKSSDVQE
jgi:hypothetical protein